MTSSDESIPEAPVPLVSIEAEKVVASSLSTDGSTILIQLADEDGDPIALTLPAGQLGDLYTAVNNAGQMLAAGNTSGPLKLTLRKPNTITILHSPDAPGHLGLAFDFDTPMQIAFLLPDQEVLRLISRLNQDLRQRSNDDRERAHRMMQPKIILPPGYKG